MKKEKRQKKGRMAKAIKQATEEPVLDLDEGEDLPAENEQAKGMKEAYWNRMHTFGRPRAYATPEEMVSDAMDYIVHCAAAHQMPNKAGLAVWMHVDASTIRKWTAESNPEYFTAVKRIHAMIEDKWVQQLGNPFNRNTAGVIFYLKNAFKKKYRDSYAADVNHRETVHYVLPKEIADKHGIKVLEQKADEPKPQEKEEQGEVVGVQ